MQNLLEHSKKSLKALSNPTSQCKDLSKCFEKGIVFHHAGLLSKQQSEIRKAFKDDRSLKIIVCTTTLAMGIDFPASYVVVRDLKRFDGNFSSFMPQSEIAQICGRAGRPRYDKEGYAVLMCSPKDEGEVDDLYLNDKVEDLYSKLSSLPFLRIHSLAAIASGYCASFEELFQFFNSTLFAFQFKNNERFLVEIERAVFELKDLDFVREKSGKLVATPIGERVSELYIDPKTAAVFLEFLNDKRMEKKEFSSIGALFVLCKSSEMRPLLNVKKTEEDALFNEAWDLDLDDTDLAEKMKTAKLLDFWTNEKTEEEILEHFSMPPGIVHGKVKIAEWLLYSLQEMAFVLNESTKYEQLKNLRRRVKHGIKEELLGLCKIRGIGRVRARKLFNAGIKTIEDYHLQPKEKIKEIILGKKSHQETLDLG
jgi:helicase